MDKKGEIYLDSRKFSIMFTYDRKGKMQFLIGYKLLISFGYRGEEKFGGQ